MGFSTALQGRQAHEAILARQDGELRLMEIMKRSIMMKAKCDREYSVGLASVAQQGLKLAAEELPGSFIIKSWRLFMDELDQQAKQFRVNAESLEGLCEKLTHLSQDKRKARKSYHEEHTKIASRLTQLTDEVLRKKSEYQKNLDGYKALRTRFEEHYIKSGRGGRKLDDVRDKYQKACRKLHLTHNEYVLSISEAVEVESDFRNTLLPGLLEHQQSVQESFIMLWKNILHEVCQYSDLTSDKFVEIQKRINEGIQDIDPAKEYVEFTEKHKTTPSPPLIFQFDETLIEDIPGKLQVNTLTVDNLTVDWLKNRLNDLEVSIKENQDKQLKMIGDMNGGSPRSNGMLNGSTIIKDPSKVPPKELITIRCQEKQKQKLADMIKCALSEVGCEELPSGCDDVEQTFIENNFNNEQQPSSNRSVSSVTSAILPKRSVSEMMTLLRAPFKRKSVPSMILSHRSPQAPRYRPRSRTKEVQKRSQSLGSLTVTAALPPVGKLHRYSSVESINKLCRSEINTNEFEPYDVPKNNKLCVPPTQSSAPLAIATNIYAELDLKVDDDEGKTYQPIESPQHEAAVTKGESSTITKSIDAQLDRIDEINRTLDRRLVKKKSDPVSEKKDKLNEIRRSTSSSSSLAKKKGFKKRSISFSQKSIHSIFNNIKGTFSKSNSPTKEKSSEDTEINDILKGVSIIKIPQSNQAKPKRSKIFRSKLLSFQVRKQKICQGCSKRRRIHPVKSVFDFAKEFGRQDNPEDVAFCLCDEAVSNNNGASGEDECVETNSYVNEDGLYIKEHMYCEPFMSYSTSRPLYEEEWFHGVLPREEVVRLLKVEGDFLVRETIRNDESQIVLSVCWNGHKHFIVQTTTDGHYRFEGPPFPSIQELILHQYQSEQPVTGKSGAILKRPVSRETWELSNDDVVLLEKIGRGNFGDVYKAKLKSSSQNVAVKTCRITLPEEQKRKFLQEGRILKQYDHPNIVKLIGICVQKQPIMIVMELVPGGSLLNFLRKNSNTLTSRQLMGMCRDAAAGMRYLESKNCIHRDLAARNCLVDLETSVKISDFGMSREEEEYIVSDGMKQIPVKWTAPEALNFGKYTSLCDVWSYGILMWEIFSKGDTPYSGMSNSRAREKIDAGYRMPIPENAPPEMYRLMLKCWASEADARPHFDEIYNVVDALIIRHDS